MEKWIAVGVIENRGKVVPVKIVAKSLETESCPRCNHQVNRGERFCSFCTFDMSE